MLHGSHRLLFSNLILGLPIPNHHHCKEFLFFLFSKHTTVKDEKWCCEKMKSNKKVIKFSLTNTQTLACRLKNMLYVSPLILFLKISMEHFLLSLFNNTKVCFKASNGGCSYLTIKKKKSTLMSINCIFFNWM